jgi:lysophospholipase L1-like esterase
MTLSAHGQTGSVGLREWLSKAPGRAAVLGVALVVIGVAIGVVIGGIVFAAEDSIIPGPVPIDLKASGRYVALGDSYSAGEGLEPFEAGTVDIEDGGDRCHRSAGFAYPLLLQFVPEFPTETVFRACSGADVENVLDVVQEHSGVANHLGLQVGPDIGGDDVTLVTISIGGNDVDFAKVLSFCFNEGPDCSQLPYQGKYETLEAWADAVIPQLKTELTGFYRRLRGAFPSARIVVLGYPALFPAKQPSIHSAHSALCSILFQRWAAPERQAIRDWGARLNRIIFEASEEAASRVEFVDIAPYFASHEPCGSGGEWVRFVGLTNDAVRQGSFHPLPDGQRMMARIVSCYLDIFSSATDPRTKQTNYAMTGCVALETAEVAESPEPAGAEA